MFDIMDKRINKKKRDKDLEQEIKDSVPKIHKALFTSPDIAATETRLEMELVKEQLLTYLLEHPEKLQQNRALFNAILEKYKAISNRISDIL